MKKIILMLLLATTVFGQNLQFKGCVNNMLKFEYQTGYSDSYNYTVTRVDKEGNDLECERSFLLLINAKESFTFEIPYSSCNDYTRIKVECVCSTDDVFKTVEKSSYCNTLLPITIYDFKGVRNNNNIKLNWKTANEKNFSHFEIYTSYNNIEYNNIGTTMFNNYKFTSTNALYIKIKCVDLDNSYEFTKTIYIKKEEEEEELILLEQRSNGDLYTNKQWKIFKQN